MGKEIEAINRRAHGVQSGWKNWKRVSEVLCDRKMTVKITGQVYRTVVRPALTYGVETCALKKAQENKLEVAEMRMQRWMSGVTRVDKIRNERIRGTRKWGKSNKQSPGKEVEMVWACGEKRGTLRRKEADGNERSGEKEERKI